MSAPGRAATYSGIGETLTAQGRAVEAIDFHRRAVATRRALPDAYRLAFELGRLAESLGAIGQTDEAQTSRTEAEGLPGSLEDPRAEALRMRLRNTEPAPGPRDSPHA